MALQDDGGDVSQRALAFRYQHPNRILTFRHGARSMASEDRRRMGGGSRLTVTQLSAKRVGISIAANAKWQASQRGVSELLQDRGGQLIATVGDAATRLAAEMP